MAYAPTMRSGTGFAVASPNTMRSPATGISKGAPVTRLASARGMPAKSYSTLGAGTFPATTVGSPMARTYSTAATSVPVTASKTQSSYTSGSSYPTTSFAAARPATTSLPVPSLRMGAPVTSLGAPATSMCLSPRGMPSTTSSTVGTSTFPASMVCSPRARTYPTASFPAMPAITSSPVPSLRMGAPVTNLGTSVRSMGLSPRAMPSMTFSTMGTSTFPAYSGTTMYQAPVAQAVNNAEVIQAVAEPSMFGNVEVAPPDAILSLAARFKEDQHPKKANLGIGAYRTEEGKPWPLPSVLAAQLVVCQDPKEDKEYVPIDGKPEHKRPVQQLIFSDSTIDAGTIATTQAISGTGSLQIIGQFLSNYMNCTVIHVPNPTWGNHNAIFKRAGVTAKNYTYYKPETRGFDFEGMMEALNEMPAGDAILLHACAQNPTGVDPTPEQWVAIVDSIRARGLIPVLDNAYQGYASGSLEKDGYSMRLFEESGLEFFVAQSFAKNFGLYGERIGYIHVQTLSTDFAAAVLSQLKILIRQAYSSPPRHGAAIVNKVLTTPELKQQWLSELMFMSQRILQMRDALRAAIEARYTPGTWNHITDQIGMFSYTGLDTAQVERMVNEFHIYMTKDGRISMAGLNPGNVEYVSECIDIVVRS